MKLVEELKKQSSFWIKTVSDQYNHFYWQNGYGLFSVNPSEIQIVEQYIRNQKTHHERKSFEEELLAFLNKYSIEYNETYLWD